MSLAQIVTMKIVMKVFAPMMLAQNVPIMVIAIIIIIEAILLLLKHTNLIMSPRLKFIAVPMIQNLVQFVIVMVRVAFQVRNVTVH